MTVNKASDWLIHNLGTVRPVICRKVCVGCKFPKTNKLTNLTIGGHFPDAIEDSNFVEICSLYIEGTFNFILVEESLSIEQNL